jgi:hypothetical protein
MIQRKSRRDRRKGQRAGTAEQPIEIAFWVVAFLDLLGYREILDGMDRHPLADAEYQEVKAAFVKATHLRRRLLGGLKEVMAGQLFQPEVPEFQTLPPHLKVMAEGFSRIKIFQLPGPDHVVIGTCLAPTQEHFPMRGVFALLFGTASTMITQLSVGVHDFEGTRPIRGGIDVALGSLLQPEDFLYSPGLTRAYKLESEEAIYPRTLIGDRLYAAIQANARGSGSLEATVAADIAQRLQRFIFTDDDGKLALDFMGEGIRECIESGFAQRLAADAWSYALKAQSKARQGGSPRVAQKYDWLVSYMRSRLKIWGVSPDLPDAV